MELRLRRFFFCFFFVAETFLLLAHPNLRIQMGKREYRWEYRIWDWNMDRNRGLE